LRARETPGKTNERKDVSVGLLSSGIEQVRVFELPSGIRADGVSVGAPRVRLVKWHSAWSDKFYQVYVNGRFVGRTVDSQQRQMVVQAPTSFESAARIEVFAVELQDAYVDFSDTLSAGGQSGRVKITLLRSQRLPVGGRFRIYWDDGTGEIDYERVIAEEPIWACREDKAGWGLSRFGESDFGWDWSAGVGFGKGSFGRGEFGVDADAIEWVSPAIGAGMYKFAVRVVDGGGREGDAEETREVTVIPGARPADGLGVKSFNKEANELVLQSG
jgi:hypothetical protein